jgi:hypothetical protein
MFGVRIVAFAAALLGVAAVVPLNLAEARPRQSSEGSYASYSRQAQVKQTRRAYAGQRSRKSYSQRSSGKIQVKATASASAGLGPRPARWCGWWMRTQLGGGPELNLARNWKGWGRPSGPKVGAVVVWSSHVGIITGRATNGQWVVKSGNDGGRVRERPRSVAGAVFRVSA